MDLSEAYAPLVTAVGRMKEPLQELMETHDGFVLQNLSMINSVKTVRDVRKSIQHGLLTYRG